MRTASWFVFASALLGAGRPALAAENPAVAFQTYDDLIQHAPGARVQVIARTRDGRIASVLLTLPNGERQMFALAGFPGYRTAWERGMGIKLTAEFQVDHVYAENAALGTGKEAFQDQLRAWRTQEVEWKRSGSIGPPPPRPRGLNYEWLRIEAVHRDVNGQVGRMLESRTARLRDRTRPVPVRRAGFFEKVKLDAAYGKPLDQIRVPVWKGRNLALVPLKEYATMESTRLGRGVRAGGLFLGAMVPAYEAKELAAAMNRFASSPTHRRTQALLSEGRYEEARRFWSQHCATANDSKRNRDCTAFQLELSRLTGTMQARTYDDFPAAMAGYYQQMEDDARDAAAGMAQLEKADQQDEPSAARPESISFDRLPPNTAVMLDLLGSESAWLVGSEATLAVRVQAAVQGVWVPLTGASVRATAPYGTVVSAPTDGSGRAGLRLQAPSEIGEHEYVLAIGSVARDTAVLVTYGYGVVLEMGDLPEPRPARADGVDAVTATIRLVKRYLRNGRFVDQAAAPGEDVQSLFLVEAGGAGEPGALRIGTNDQDRGETGRGYGAVPDASGRITLSMVAQRPAVRTIVAHARGGRLAALQPASLALGQFPVRFERAMPGLALEWVAPPRGARLAGDRMLLEVPAGSLDLRELQVRAITRRSGTPAPVSAVQLRIGVTPADALQLYRADAVTGADGLARAGDGKWPGVYKPTAGRTVVTIGAEGSANALTLEIAATDADAPADLALDVEPLQSVVEVGRSSAAVLRGVVRRDGRETVLPSRYGIVVEGTNGARIDASERYRVSPPRWSPGNEQSRFLELGTDSAGHFEFTVGAPEHGSQVVRVRLWDSVRNEFLRTREARVDFVQPGARGEFPAADTTVAGTDGLARGKGRVVVLVLDADRKPMPILRWVQERAGGPKVASSRGGPLDVDAGEYDLVIPLPETQRHRVRVRAGEVQTVRVEGLGRLTFEARDGLGEAVAPHVYVRRAGTDQDLNDSFGPQPLELPPGSYDVAFALPHVALVRHHNVIVRSYQTTTVHAGEYGRITFDLADATGAQVERAVSIRRGDTEVAFSFGNPVDVPPGSYVAVVSYDEREVRVPVTVTAGRASAVRAKVR